jgi:sugar lactone lactonase YvrE
MELLFIADARASQILQLDDDGAVVRRLGSKGHAAAQFDLPHMHCIDSQGNILVAEVGNRRLQTLKPAQGDDP